MTGTNCCNEHRGKLFLGFGGCWEICQGCNSLCVANTEDSYMSKPARYCWDLSTHSSRRSTCEVNQETKKLKLYIWTHILSWWTSHSSRWKWDWGFWYGFQGGDEAIIAEAKWKLAVERDEVIEVDSDLDEAKSNSKEPTAPGQSWAKLMQMCEELEAAYIAHSNADFSLQLPWQLCEFHGLLRKEELQSAKQTMYAN